MGPRDYEDRIEEYDDGYDSRESFERAESDTEESLREDYDDEDAYDRED